MINNGRLRADFFPGRAKFPRGRQIACFCLPLGKHLKDTIFLKKTKNILFWSAREREGDKAPLLFSLADEDEVSHYCWKEVDKSVEKEKFSKEVLGHFLFF